MKCVWEAYSQPSSSEPRLGVSLAVTPSVNKPLGVQVDRRVGVSKADLSKVFDSERVAHWL